MPRPSLHRLLSPLHVLVGATAAELLINRVLVPATRPTPKPAIAGVDPPLLEPPTWHVLLDNLGLFLLYFVGVLAAGWLLLRATTLTREPGRLAARVSRAATIATGVAVAAIALVGAVTSLGPTMTLALEITFAAGVVATVIALWLGDGDRGLRLGGTLLALPFLLRFLAVVATPSLTETATAAETLTTRLTLYAALMMATAAILSPYCLGPRPLGRSILRIPPIVLAVVAGAVFVGLIKWHYGFLVDAATRAVGVYLSPTHIDRNAPAFLLGVATLTWTLAACAMAPAEARRRIGMGIALVACAGIALAWPAYLAVALVGLCVLVDAGAALPGQEPRDLRLATPPIDDTTWQAFTARVSDELRQDARSCASVTSRGPDQLVTTTWVGHHVDGLPFMLRAQRMDRALVMLEVQIGERFDDERPADAVLAPRNAAHPGPPPSRIADEVTDVSADVRTRFRCHGDAAVVARAIPAPADAVVAQTLDGWLAIWSARAVHYRVFPGNGAPVDVPIDVAGLASRRVEPNAGQRLATVVRVCVDIAARCGVLAATATNDDDQDADEPTPAPEAAPAPEPAPEPAA